MTVSHVEVTRRSLLGSGFAGLAASAMIPDQVLAAAVAAKHRSQASLDYTTGHYQPTLHELTVSRLEVTGAIPPELSGRYFRNGHNPKPENTPPYWFEGNGMIHGVRIKGGQAEWYRNRWVRTPALHGAPLIRPDKSVDLTASAAATSVYAHAGRIYALQEVNLPFLVGPELQTLGPFDFAGKLKQPMTAHPKIDQKTGEMLFMSYGPMEPHLTYFRVSPKGDLTHIENIPGAGPTIMHDFAVTPNYVLFLDPSVVFDPASKLAFPYRWDDNYQAKIGVMPRDRTKGPITWIAVEPNFYFHISNAWEEDDGTLRMENTFYDKAGWDKFAKWLMSQPGHLPWLVQGDKFARWTIDPKAGTATREMRTDISNDFPTINQTYLGRRNRYTYAEAFPRGPLRHNAVIKIDGQTGDVAVREFPDGQQPEEPWFVPAPNGTSEDDGWLFSFVGDVRTKRGALHILDAKRIHAKPVAVIQIPGWVPAGVHGSWIDDSVLVS